MGIEDKYYIIGVDGGATKTDVVLFDDSGNTLATLRGSGTSLTVYEEQAPVRIFKLIQQICKKAGISHLEVDAIGLGIAGSSNEHGRDLVFRELEAEQMTRSILIASDAEAAYEVGCPTGPGFLVSVGTGIICMSRTVEGKILRTAGKGHDDGDEGSAYWIGKKVLIDLSLGDSHVYHPEDMIEVRKTIEKSEDSADFDSAVEKIMTSPDSVAEIAALAVPICALSEAGNEYALAVIQEGTQAVADYIIDLVHLAEFKGQSILLAGNGGLITNQHYRKSVNDALQFDFRDISWLFSKLSPAYGAGLLAARLIDLDTRLEDIVKRIKDV